MGASNRETVKTTHISGAIGLGTVLRDGCGCLCEAWFKDSWHAMIARRPLEAQTPAYVGYVVMRDLSVDRCWCRIKWINVKRG